MSDTPAAKPAANSLSGSWPLFRLFGVTVYMHWSWLLVAYLEYQFRKSDYSSRVWNLLEYLTLFGIVLLHEFGHALACRSVGGRADRIVLWPLGGIAFVQPPLRPGPILWSIAAGPLVNVILIPFTLVAAIAWTFYSGGEGNPDVGRYLTSITILNIALLVFNMMPVYPLDGGQILQALLWFVIGRGRSLLVVSVIGLGATALGLVWAIVNREAWIGILAGFMGMRCWAGLKQARLLGQMARLPRHPEASCPACKAHPIAAELWNCDDCQTRFDTFVTGAQCPACGKLFPDTQCIDCQEHSPVARWFGADRPLAGT